ncbi:MAG: KTSC domain-containing protein [Proteobacteria bacterium]|nr:MAG: KTSC domain-containing protein [Pseudomonadota bacterium]
MPSTVIRFFRHDPETRELLVVFQTGRRYVYRGVPESEALAMRAAFSKGEYFNSHIRDRYPFERLE